MVLSHFLVLNILMIILIPYNQTNNKFLYRSQW